MLCELWLSCENFLCPLLLVPYLVYAYLETVYHCKIRAERKWKHLNRSGGATW